MAIRISLLHASYRSRFKGRDIRDTWLDLADNPNLIEHCLGLEETDFEVRKEFDLSDEEFGESKDRKTKFITSKPTDTPSAVRNWNNAARISSGDLLLGIADDLVPEKHWDSELIRLVGEEYNYGLLWKLKDSRCNSFVDSVSDDSTPRHPLMTRKLYEEMGFYFDPRYVSVGPDNEWLLRGLKLGILRDGRMFKLHHSVGDVLDGNKNLICSCNNALFKPSLPNKSQERMHSTLSIDIAQREYYKWNYFWLLVGWIGVQKKFGINLICHSSGRLGRLPLYLITRTLLNLNLTLKDRARLIFGLAIESRVIYKNRRKVKYRSLAK